jgi:hypothetical protein
MRLLQCRQRLVWMLALLAAPIWAYTISPKAVRVDAKGIHIQGKTVHLNQDSSVWIAALGPPSRRVQSISWKGGIKYLVWDHLGIAVEYYGYTGQVASVRYVFFFFLPVRAINWERAMGIDGGRHMYYSPRRYTPRKVAKLSQRYDPASLWEKVYKSDPLNYPYTFRKQRLIDLAGIRVGYHSRLEAIQAHRNDAGQAPLVFHGHDRYLPECWPPSEPYDRYKMPYGYFRARLAPPQAADAGWVYLFYTAWNKLFYVCLRADNA